MKNTLLERLKTALCQHLPVSNGTLVAVSGGKDSMVLMTLLKEVQAEVSLNVTVGHYDHGWRSESEQDAIFVLEEAARMGFSCIIGRPEVPPSEAEQTETIARKQRYQFLTKTASEHDCDSVLTAHTADDQVETVLHNIFRGTGLAGLSGMNWTRSLGEEIQLIRPLLDASRVEIDEYAQENSVPFRDDCTNDSLKYTRNLIRHDVLVWLESRGFVNARDSVLRLSQQADEVQQALVWVVNEVLDRALLSSSSENVELSSDVLESLPRHLVREVFVEIWRRQSWPRQQMGFSEWERLADLIHSCDRFHVSGRIDCCQKRGKILLQREPG